MPDGSMQMNPFWPCDLAADDNRDLRAAFSRFATGVTVVTAQSGGRLVGMTANSFSSVSMKPPMVLWCPAKSSTRFDAFRTADHFAIHVLGAQDRDLALAFARSGDAFDACDYEVNAHGVPLLGQCLARFECETHQIHDAGDHAIVVGRVRSAAYREGEALIFSQGQFRQFDKKA